MDGHVPQPSTEFDSDDRPNGRRVRLQKVDTCLQLKIQNAGQLTLIYSRGAFGRVSNLLRWTDDSAREKSVRLLLLNVAEGSEK